MVTVVAPLDNLAVKTKVKKIPVQVNHWRFSVDDYYRMRDVGVLTEDDRVELIDGGVYEMCPIDPVHAAQVDRLTRLLTKQCGEEIIVRVQNPIRLDGYNEPQPDLALVRWQEDFYAQSHPTPADVLIAIEVANSSLAADRKVKLPWYALAGIPEVWLINIARQSIEQYTQPINNSYTTLKVVNRGQILVAQTIAGLEFPLTRIFGH
jgi:Uma2 family endonuclease